MLIQGETSVGKTSLVRWLAAATGNQCVRINNHEHTDIQEYIGCYSSDEQGKLVFKEGTILSVINIYNGALFTISYFICARRACGYYKYHTQKSSLEMIFIAKGLCMGVPKVS